MMFGFYLAVFYYNNNTKISPNRYGSLPISIRYFIVTKFEFRKEDLWDHAAVNES